MIRWPAAVRTALPGPGGSPAGCFSWWGRSAPEAAPKPPPSVRTGPRSEAPFPSRGSVGEGKERRNREGRGGGVKERRREEEGGEKYGNDEEWDKGAIECGE